MLIPTITLQPGDSGDNVRELQRRLVAVDQLSEGQINGSYDGPTTESVRGFQGMQGLNVDGIAGPRTIRKLNAVVAGTASSDDSGSKQEEEEVEQEIETSEAIELALQEQERQKTEDELGLAEPAPDVPLPPQMEAPKVPDLEAMGGTADSLFLDDPNLDMDVTKSKDVEVEAKAKEAELKAPKEQEAKHQAGEELAKAEAAEKASIAPPEPKEPIRFEDKKLDAMDKSLSEPTKMEVKQAGEVMMKNGVKEVAVPAEMQIGGPSQTPQQQKQQGAELG